MKNNQPVTQQEYPVRPDCAIVSHTDTKGRITYVNEDFIEYAGFTLEELIGQPHNIIRHPDMPEEAFRDMWATLKAGRAWQGMVKNRRKNGDHYWVKATATPLSDGGYMSVRMMPSRSEVAAAEALYARMRNGSGHRLRDGYVLPPGPTGRLAALRMRIGGWPLRLKLLVPLLCAGLFGLFALIHEARNLFDASLHEAGRNAAANLISSASNARSFYSQEILPKARQAGLDPSHAFHGDPKALPLPASFMRAMGEMSAGASTGNLRLYSDAPFRFRRVDEVRLDAFEQEALAALRANPSGSFGRLEFVEGKPVYRFARADVMSDASCVSCHNSHPDSPRTDWKIGDVRGVIQATVPLSALSNEITDIYTRAAGVMLVIGTLMVALFWWLVGGQGKRIGRLAHIAEQIAGGNLKVEVPAGKRDEIGSVFNKLQIMRNKLYEIAFELSRGAESLTASTRELATASSVTAEGAIRQSETASSIAATVEQLSASIDHLTASAREAHAKSADAGEAAAVGARVVHAAATEISGIAKAVQQSSEKVSGLQAVSSEIGSIVSAIREIADQTNLLALNAAIEAARAGESGRGFAVVADEVRKLAERTATATNEISSMVGRIQTQTAEAVDDMRAGVARVDKGVHAAHDAGDSVMSIREKAVQAGASTQDMLVALQQQAAAAHEVAQRVEDIATAAERGAASSEESSAATQQIAERSVRIQQLAAQFKT